MLVDMEYEHFDSLSADNLTCVRSKVTLSAAKSYSLKQEGC